MAEGAVYKINKNNSQNLIYLSALGQFRNMYNDLMFTPKNKPDLGRTQRVKRFARKPVEKSQRSSSKKSFDSSVKQMYIKSPTSMARDKGKDIDFFATLASSLITSTSQTYKKQQNTIKYKPRYTERGQDIYLHDRQNNNEYDDDRANSRANYRINALQAEIQLKNHEIIILSGEVQRLKSFADQDKEKRKKLQGQKKQLSKQLKQATKAVQNTRIQVRKLQKQKDHLLKQIQFLQRINYDQKTRTLQSYRQKYLQGEVQRLKKQVQRSKGQRQQQLQWHLKTLKQQKFTIDSHYKAMKVANQCLIKQINHTQQHIHDIILNSEQYTKLRDKYVRFLQEYKLLRNQYWSLKAEMGKQQLYRNDSSSLFSITASQVESDLSILKNSTSNPNLANLLSFTTVQKPIKTKSLHQEETQPTYSNK